MPPANSLPSTDSTRRASSLRGRCSDTRPLCRRLKATSARDSAARFTTASQCANSVASDFRNLRRAGVLK